jgi:hypothetical protein
MWISASVSKGNKGQFIYASPQKKLVIVRNGIEYGLPSEEWLTLFYEFTSRWQGDAVRRPGNLSKLAGSATVELTGVGSGLNPIWRE